MNSWANNHKASQGVACSEVVNRDHRLKCDMYVSCPASQFSNGTLMPQTFRRWIFLWFPGWSPTYCLQRRRPRRPKNRPRSLRSMKRPAQAVPKPRPKKIRSAHFSFGNRTFLNDASTEATTCTSFKNTVF